MLDKEKLGKRGLKKATAAIDMLMQEHCGVKRTRWYIVLFMSAAKYALHVQRKFSMLDDMQKARMNTIGKKIAKRANHKKIKIEALKIIESAKNSGLEKAYKGE